MPESPKVKIRLTSKCNVEGSVGNPGDVVSMPRDLAGRVVAGKGGIDIVAEKRAKEAAAKQAG